MADEHSSSVCGIVTAFAIGALVGAGVALLYAPQSGKETRELLARKAREVKDKAGELKDRAEEAFDDAKEIVRGK